MLALATCLAAASGAAGATTIGASAAGTPTAKPASCTVATLNVAVSCTLFVGTFADPAEAAPGGNFSPIDGVVARWRVSVGASGTTSLTLTPRVLGFTTQYLALRSGAPQAIPAAGGTFDFEGHVPISEGDFFGIDSVANGAVGAGPAVIANIATNASYVAKSPAIPDGSPFSALGSIGPPTQTKLMISATVEPDADGDTYGDETQDLCPSRADVHTACPPPVVTKPTFVDGAFNFTSDIAGKAKTTLSKVSDGRKVGQKCKSKRKSGKKCKIYTKFAQWNDDVVPGLNKISYEYKVGGKTLKPGKYRATIVITSAQSTVTTQTVDFTIKKAKKKRK